MSSVRLLPLAAPVSAGIVVLGGAGGLTIVAVLGLITLVLLARAVTHRLRVESTERRETS